MGAKKVILPSTIFVFISAFFIFGLTGTVFAVTITVDDYPQTITQDPFEVTVSVSGASPATNYLRVDLYKEGTTNYFGETYNGTDWYGSSTYSQYLPITIDSTKNWSGQIQARIGSPSQTEYDWEGLYKMRIRRYTSSGGSDATEANNSSVTVAINIPKPSPSPSPSPAQTPSPNPSPSTTPPKSPSPTPKQLASPALKSSLIDPQVLGTNSNDSTASAGQSPESSPSVDVPTATTPIKIAALLIGSGLILIAISAGAYIWYKKKLNSKNTQDEDNTQNPKGDII